jgi:TolB protein
MRAPSLVFAVALLALAATGCGGGEDAATPSPAVTAVPTGSPTSTALPTPTPEAQTLPFVPDPTELYVVDVDGTSVMLLSSGTGHPTALSWAPDGKRVAFGVRIGSGESELHIVAPSDRSREVIVDIDGWMDQPLWSPSGERLAVYHSVADRGSLEVMRYDGSGRREVVSATDPNYGASVIGWLSEQKLLAVRGEELGSVLLELDVDSGEAREVAVLNGRVEDSDLSDDGGRVVVNVSTEGDACDWPSTNSLWVVDMASGQPQQVGSDTCGVGAVAWSPDGTEIAYSVVGGQQQDTGVYVANVASGDTRRITDSHYATEVVWLPDGSAVLGRLIGCYGCTPGPPSLVLAPAAGGPEQVLLASAEFEVSPDARSVVFAKDGVQVSTLSGDQPRTLLPTDPDWQYAYFNWSPDGRQVSFMRFHGFGARQFEVDIDGTDVTRLPNLDWQDIPHVKCLTGWERCRIPSPDGTKVLALDVFPPSIEDVQSGAATALSPPYPAEVSWSPDSRRLAFSSYYGNVYPSMYLMNADGTGLLRLTNEPDSGSAPAFSPDGRLLAFLRGAKGEKQLVVVDPDTLQEKVLLASATSSGSAEDWPVWSPDGELLALVTMGVDGRGIYVVNGDGSGAYRLVAGNGVGRLTGVRWLTDTRLYFIAFTDTD